MAGFRAEPIGGDRLTYGASMTLPSAGEYTLEAAAGDGSRPGERFPQSVQPITVVEAAPLLGDATGEPLLSPGSER